MNPVARWARDLALGARLGLGGGRASWVRLALTAAGIGLGVAVLLAAASVPTVVSERAERRAAQSEVRGQQAPGQDVLHVKDWGTEFRGQGVDGRFVRPTGPGAPVPPGLPRLPADDEVYLSPALARLLDSPEGGSLRERFPQRVAGAIGQEGLGSPHDLYFIAGDDTIEGDPTHAVLAFGAPPVERRTDQVLVLLVLVGSVALLFPVLVFVGISTRLAGAQRDRRLAALRLVGAGARRVRRIAAGEALLGAAAGLGLGAALFLAARPLTERVQVVGLSAFADDLAPVPWLVALIAAMVPVLAVLTSILAMRRTVVEPLGVVRQTRPARRALWWRVAPVALGAAALATQAGSLGGLEGRASEPAVVGGTLLLLLGVPVLLPWAVERVVARLRGGTPSWQLAVRRLQLDSGAAARVVGGVAVVLAGGIALQSVMAGAAAHVEDRPVPETDRGQIVVSLSEADRELAESTTGLLRRATGVSGVHPLRSLVFRVGADDHWSGYVGDCAALRTQADLPPCRDGDAFLVGDQGSVTPINPLRGGEEAVVLSGQGDQEREVARWTVPRFTTVERSSSHFAVALLLTPAALGGLEVPTGHMTAVVEVDPGRPEAAEGVRNAIAPLTWRATTYYSGEVYLEQRVREFREIRRALLAGSLLTLLLAGASLLVLTLEQVRERRRPLAVLVACGVPRAALGRSLLWQNALPLLLGLVVAVAVGAALAVSLLRIIGRRVVLDWAGIGLLTGASAAIVVVVTLLTLPALRRATGALGLRSE